MARITSTELTWNKIAAGWEAETWPDGNWYHLSEEEDQWRLQALVGDEMYNLTGTQEEMLKMADELVVQSYG